MVALGAPVHPDVVQVDIDNRGAFAQIARHVSDLGHHRVAHVTLPAGLTGTAGEPVRRAAELARTDYPDVALRAAGLIDVFGPDVPTAVAASGDVEGGHEAGRLLLDVAPALRPTAVLAQSDLLAVGVIRAAQDLGLDVPGQLSVAGFDAVPLDWWQGRLTTIEQPATGKGAAAGRAVHELLQGRRPADSSLPTRLRIGDTTAEPASWTTRG